MAQELIFKDPVTGNEYPIRNIKLRDLQPSPFQREISKSLHDSLMFSISNLGFISIPLVVENGGNYYVVDGMHRIEALKEIIGVDNEVMCLIIPNDKKFMYSLYYNIEKAPNIKEKSKQVYKMYIDEIENNPEELETSLKGLIEFPYYITCGIALEEVNPRFSPSAFEDIIKKLDYKFHEEPLIDMYKVRKSWAEKMNEVWLKVDERFKELGLKNFFLKSAILKKAFQNKYGQRVRQISDDFITCMENIKNEIPNVYFSEE